MHFVNIDAEIWDGWLYELAAMPTNYSFNKSNKHSVVA